MEYANHLSEYASAASEAQVAETVARMRETAKKYETAEVCKFCFSALDLTTLSCSDSVESVTAFAKKTVHKVIEDIIIKKHLSGKKAAAAFRLDFKAFYIAV